MIQRKLHFFPHCIRWICDGNIAYPKIWNIFCKNFRTGWFEKKIHTGDSRSHYLQVPVCGNYQMEWKQWLKIQRTNAAGGLWVARRMVFWRWRFLRPGVQQQSVVTEHFSDVDVVERQPRTWRPHHMWVVWRGGRLRVVQGGCLRDECPAGTAASPLSPRSPAFNSHHLKNLASLEGRPREEYHGTGNVSGLDADHVRILVVTEILDFFRFIYPRIPNHCVWEVILLYSHFPSWHYVRYYMFLWCVSIYSVCPFTYCNYITCFLVCHARSRLQDIKEKK